MLTFLLVAVFVLLGIDVVGAFLIWKWFRAVEREANLLMFEVLKLRQETSAGKEPPYSVANIVHVRSHACIPAKLRPTGPTTRPPVLAPWPGCRGS